MVERAHLSPEDVIAERELAFSPYDRVQGADQVLFRLGRPVETGPVWTCSFEVVGLGETRVESARGADSVQALLLALAKLRVLLGVLAADHEGHLEFAGRLGAGLPSLFEEAGVEEVSRDATKP